VFVESRKTNVAIWCIIARSSFQNDFYRLILATGFENIHFMRDNALADYKIFASLIKPATL